MASSIGPHDRPYASKKHGGCGFTTARSICATQETEAVGVVTGSSLSPQGAALYVGAVLGAGILALPSLAAKVAGPASMAA
jgi:sulfopyruvate decarboxylase TPP-binding subunit